MKHVILCALVLGLAVPAPASIVAVTGSVSKIDAPDSAEMPGFIPHPLKSDTTIWAFDEQQSLRLDSDVHVNIILPGTYGPSNDVLTPGTIRAGTLVNSHFVHFQPAGSVWVDLGGSMTFDQDILGLITLSSVRDPIANLNDTDGLLGSPTTIYATKDARGAELDPGGLDQITWLGTDRRTLHIDQLHAMFPGDQIRIVTAAVPESSTIALWLIAGLIGLGFGWLRKRRAA